MAWTSAKPDCGSRWARLSRRDPNAVLAGQGATLRDSRPAPRLPRIALATYVDTLDLRVYSTKRGRMWRTPNYKRKNGLYKVQVTVDEFMDATPETYVTICSKPRRPIPTTPYIQPQTGLGLHLGQGEGGRCAQEAQGAQGIGLNRHPVRGTVAGLCAAPDDRRVLKEGVGWNQIALQLRPCTGIGQDRGRAYSGQQGPDRHPPR